MVLVPMPFAEEPAGTLDAIEQTDGRQEGLEPSTLGPLQQPSFELVEERSSNLGRPLLGGRTKLKAQQFVGVPMRLMIDGLSMAASSLGARVAKGDPLHFDIYQDMIDRPQLEHTLKKRVL